MEVGRCPGGTGLGHQAEMKPEGVRAQRGLQVTVEDACTPKKLPGEWRGCEKLEG